MGSALLRGWISDVSQIAGKTKSSLTMAVVEPHIEDHDSYRNTAEYEIKFYADASLLPGDFIPEVIVLAVKPQAVPDILSDYRRFVGPGGQWAVISGGKIETWPLVISIAAGKSLIWFEQQLGISAAMIRAMPNTPALVGRGVTVCCANSRVSTAQQTFCGELFGTVGKVIWLAEENLMDAVTALSGSGPAYVFLLMDILVSSGISVGLPRELATQITRATIEGSAELAHQRPSDTAESLRQSVTSPGGTTSAALEVLTDGRLQSLFDQAISAAITRARKL